MLLCCISGFSQTLGGPSAMVSGQTYTITVNGESDSKYVSYVNYPGTYNTSTTYNGTVYITGDGMTGSTVYYQLYGVPANKTTFQFKASSNFGSDMQVTFVFNVNYSSNNGSTGTQGQLSFTTILKPVPAPPQSTTYYNVAKSGSFTKNDCSQASGTGSTVTYTVPAHTYGSTASQADADQQAQNDVNTNGQAYANTNGTCTSCFPQISSSTIDGVPFQYGTAISIGYHTLIVNCSANPQITFTSYSGNNIQISQQYYGSGTGTCYFYYSGGSAAIRVTEINQCYNRFEQIAFSQR